MQRRYDGVCPICKIKEKRYGSGYCQPCNNEQMQKWRKLNIEHYRENQRKWNNKKKLEIYKHYGNECACCGETEKAFLTIDHKYGGGNIERKQYHSQTWKLVIKNNYPSYYQILCFNCNNAKHNLGKCPHRNIKK